MLKYLYADNGAGISQHRETGGCQWDQAEPLLIPAKHLQGTHIFDLVQTAANLNRASTGPKWRFTGLLQSSNILNSGSIL